MGLGVSHYSPLVPNHLQYNTSEILAWQEACQTENLGMIKESTWGKQRSNLAS